LLASALKISDVGMSTPKAESPGAMMRIRTPHGPNEIEWDSDYNLALTPGVARVVSAFPHRMFVSGFTTKPNSLAGTPLETVEKVGVGSVTVFGYEPNFRAVADGSARLLRQAILDAHRLGALDDTQNGAQQDAAPPAALGRAEPRPHASLAPRPRQPGGPAGLTLALPPRMEGPSQSRMTQSRDRPGFTIELYPEIPRQPGCH
jgi:hypothetical protein